MRATASFVDDIVARSCQVHKQLAQDPVIGRFVDGAAGIPRPFGGTGEIRLMIIGQDPTVNGHRPGLCPTTVLNLDMRGGLLRFIASLCQDLGVGLKENVYATNAAKNCFVERPTAIRSTYGVDVLELSAPLWLPVLRAELERFPDALVISLGEPVLSMLVRSERGRAMRDYWGYDKRWKAGARLPIHPIEAEDSAMDRRIYPFIHQPSLRGRRTEFYRERREEYMAFIRSQHGLD